MRELLLTGSLLLALTTAGVPAQQAGNRTTRPPIIDVHLHVSNLTDFGGIRVVNCASPLQEFAPRDGRPQFGVNDVRRRCDMPVTSPASEDEYFTATMKYVEQYNMTAVLGGALDRVLAWKAKAPDPSRIIPSVRWNNPRDPSVRELREIFTSGRASVLGEANPQGRGIAPDHPSLEPYYALLEELDIPIAIHVGLGAPSAAYVGQPDYLASLSNPLLLEPVLRRHPRLRINVMHAGWPMLNAMIALMYSHPQVYVDTGVINWAIPRKEFHTYLKRLVEAGFGHRIMFGSDQSRWPDAIPASIEAIEQADFLTEAQKRDIFYNNAARFLRLKTPPASASR